MSKDFSVVRDQSSVLRRLNRNRPFFPSGSGREPCGLGQWLSSRVGYLLAVICLLLTTHAHAEVCANPFDGDPQAAMMWRRLADMPVVGVYDHPVRLSGGEFLGEPFVAGGSSRPVLRLWPELFSIGDLDGQAGEEIVGLLSETSGGSGERVYLIVAKLAETTAATVPAWLAGDRVKVRGLQIKDRRIILDIVEAGELEPLCCGTTLSRLALTLEPNGLRLAEKISQGFLSLRVVEGQTWQLVDEGTTRPPVYARCTTLTVSGEEITGHIGDKRYSGKIIETAPGQIAISRLASSVETGPDAPTAQEESYLSLLASVTQYTFLAGRLTLVGMRADHPVMLKFAPVEIRSP